MSYTHKIVRKGHYVTIDGLQVLLPAGSPYTPNAAELEAFPDRFQALAIQVPEVDSGEPEEVDVLATPVNALLKMIEDGELDAEDVLEVESERTDKNPRSTLIKALEDLIGGGGDTPEG